MRRSRPASRSSSTRRSQELVRKGVGNPAEIAYAAIVSGYYDDPVILDCVREMLTIDSDLRDMTAAFLPSAAEPTREQLHAIAGALRNVVLRHARYRCSQCGLDSSTFLWHCPALSRVGHAARRRGARVPAEGGAAAIRGLTFAANARISRRANPLTPR